MLTKGHVRYLESRLIKLAEEAGAVALTNDTHPDFQRLPEADRADMDTFVGNAALVLPILGADLFRRRQRPQAATQADREPAGAVANPVLTFGTAGASPLGVSPYIGINGRRRSPSNGGGRTEANAARSCCLNRGRGRLWPKVDLSCPDGVRRGRDKDSAANAGNRKNRTVS
jgi:hypothetical protein